VYDMYPWHEDRQPSAPGGDPGRPAARAVQTALDRRDNGGAAAAEPPGPPALPGPAAP
jgi:hypothetical protein